MDTISMEIYNIIKSTEETMRKRPNVIIPNKEKYSPFLYNLSSSDCRLTIEISIVDSNIRYLKKVENGSSTIASLNNVVVLLS